MTWTVGPRDMFEVACPVGFRCKQRDGIKGPLVCASVIGHPTWLYCIVPRDIRGHRLNPMCLTQSDSYFIHHRSPPSHN